VIALVAIAAALSVAVVPRLFGYSTLLVEGGSMGESIPNGGLVFARWVAAEDLELGDVLVIQEETDDSPTRPKIHRIVSLDEEDGNILARTKGDANDTADPNLYVLPDDVLTPAYTVPYLGYLASFALTPLGWLVLVALPAALVCLYTLRAIWSPGQDTAAEHGAT
jgi:signal peptidase